jgi:predicted permease
MPAEGCAGPPRLADLLVRWRLPSDVADAVAGDLHEEYALRIAPSRGALAADLWYWGQVLSLRAGALRRVSRRLKAMKPTWERNRPRRVGHDQPDFWSRMPMRPDDLKYAVRRLVRSPGFTLVAVLSLALGIGANTAMFSVVNAVLIRHLPVRAPQEMVEVYTSESDGYPYATFSHPDYMDLREDNDAFAGIVGTRTFIARMDRGDEPEILFGEAVSWDYFSVLGVRMALGRSFVSEEDETPETHPVAILGYRMWADKFGADPAVVGKDVRLGGRAFTIVGVAPEAFTGSIPVMVTGLYVPLMMTGAVMPDASDQFEQRGSRSMFVKARLNPGVSVEQANAELEAFAAGLAERFPDTNEKRVMTALRSGDVALHPIVDKALVPVAALLLGVVGLVLLIACANLASFLLARAEDRRKEIAIRLALGAGRGALVRQLLVETVLLATLGGLAGIVLADWTLGLLMSFRPPLPIPVSFDISLDRTVLLFTAGVSVLAGLTFGLAPALQATNPDVAPTLKDEGTGGGRPRRFNLRSGLVVTQVAFSFVLLIGAGLFVRSLQKAQAIDPGFYTGPAALVWPMPQLSGYGTGDEARLIMDEYGRRLLADPGVTGVAMADRLPLGAGIQTRGYVIPGSPSETPDGTWAVDNATVSPSYFDVMDVPILQGRPFEEADREGDPVVIVSEAFVHRFYPGEDVVGRSIETRGGDRLQIVGVARDAKVRTLGEAPRPYVYQAMRTADFFGTQLVVRGRGTSADVLATAQSVLRDLDPDMVVMEAKTMNEHLAIMLFAPRMGALLLAVFGGLALVLSAIGIYGVVSYAVAKRTRELGIRMSLGASARDVVVMAVSGGMRLVLVGGGVGVLLAAAVTWSLKGFLFGIQPTDLVTFALIPVLLTGVALLAAFVPARRASAVNPVTALRRD